jgi:Ca2+-transporting ATPase
LPASVLFDVLGYLPVLRDLFHFAPLHLTDLAICLLAGAVSVLWFEGLKVLRGAKAARAPLSQ